MLMPSMMLLLTSVLVLPPRFPSNFLVSCKNNIHQTIKMNLPIEPTTMPPVRRYTRTFNADRTKVYREGDQIKIQIPPIQNTYLTKNSKLYFDFDLSYNMYTQDDLNNIITVLDNSPKQNWGADVAFLLGKIFDGNVVAQDNNDAKLGRMATKPFPTFDINGAYGLFSRIQVHDYLGTTLLEDIERHDILTAMMSDFDLTTEDVEVCRPTFTTNDVTILNSNVRKANAVLPFNSLFDFESFMTEILPMTITADSVQDPTNINIFNITNVVTKTSIPTYNVCLNLYSFLGRLSSKFVPLHNGFTITLFVNQINIPVSFCNSISTKIVGNNTEIVFPYHTFTCPLNPSIISHSISNVSYKCDLLELSSELDSKVEKLIHKKSYSYTLDFSYSKNYDLTKRILPSVKSLRRVLIGQRYKTASKNNTLRDLSFRTYNGSKLSQLLFNKSVLNENSGVLEHYESIKSSFGKTINNYYNLGDMYDESVPNSRGQQSFPLLNLNIIQEIRDKFKNYYTTPTYIFDDYDIIPTSQISNGGKFMIVFDTRVPGSTDDTIAGIDTSNNNVEYRIVYDPDNTVECFLDVFCEFDAVVHVDPGNSTSVSF